MPTCSVCRKPTTGHSITALDRTWHADCFRCAGCGRVIKDSTFQSKDNQPYHESCYHDRFSPRCARCGKPITGVYTKALGKDWHPEHFGCAQCGKPFQGANFHERDGKAYCEEHYWQRFGKVCAIGGEFLKGEYVINGWGDTYCHDHARGQPECFSCGRVICQRLTGGGVRYNDNRHLCNRCRRTAVTNDRDGQAVLMQVRGKIAGWGLDIGRAETPLRLVDQDELTKRSTKAHTQKPAGMACHQTTTQNGQVVERRVEAILILHGLPQEHFAAVAAHELCHSYLFMNVYPELEPVVEEGLCELSEYLWLRQQNTAEAQHRIAMMEKNDDPIYGQGFRAARKGYERLGLSGLLDYVHRHRRLSG